MDCVMGYSVEPRVELALRRTLFFSLFILFYLIFGASVLFILPRGRLPSKCERNVEKLDAHRSEMLNVLWAETMAQSEHDWAQMANHKLDIYERALLNSCARTVAEKTPNSFKNAFLQAFSLITTIGFHDADILSTFGKLFAMVYATIGIPLTLLYLGQCSKTISGLLPGNKLLMGACLAIFVTAIVHDITEESDEDTPFLDAIFHAFLVLSTVGHCSVPLNGAVVFLSIVALGIVSVSFVVLQKHIEFLLQGPELSFARWLGSFRRAVNKKTEDDNRILEEAEEESEDSEA